MAQPNPKRLLRAAGALFWLAMGIERVRFGPPGVAWVVLWLGFGAGYFWMTHPRPVPARPPPSLVATAAHEDLLATQALLTESTRALERLRISRELHDALGHHLTALLLRLEAAAVRPNADPDLGKAVEQARAAIAEVSGALGELRARGAVDIRPALRTLAAAMARPRVHLELANDLRIPDSRISHAVFRCVQEIVTNSARHARAENLWIDCKRAKAGLEISARDDGRGASSLRFGAGLRGMRARLEEAGGWLEVDAGPGRGFALRAWVPLPEPA